MVKKGVKIEAPSGKLGILIPGLGAVSTTFIAGVEAIKKKIAQPIGSLTQLGTIRLGKRTERRVPKIHDFVPLASLDDLVFGGWDIYEDNCYEGASKAGVLEKTLLDAGSSRNRKNQAVESRFQPGLRQKTARSERQVRQEQDGTCRTGHGRHRAVPQDEQPLPHGHGLVRQHRGLPESRSRTRHDPSLRKSASRERSGDHAQHGLRLCRSVQEVFRSPTARRI